MAVRTVPSPGSATVVGVAEGATVGVEAGRCMVDVADGGTAVTSAAVFATEVPSSSCAVPGIDETCAAATGSVGTILGVTVGPCSTASADPGASETIAAGGGEDIGPGRATCPLRKNAAAATAATTPAPMATMRARHTRSVPSSRTIGKMVARTSRADREATISRTTITARLNPAIETSNMDSRDIGTITPNLQWHQGLRQRPSRGQCTGQALRPHGKKSRHNREPGLV
jgi:hypothetical protein